MRKSSPQIGSARHVETLAGLSPIVEVLPDKQEKPNTDRVATVKLKPIQVLPEEDGLKVDRSENRESGRYSFTYTAGNTDVVSRKKR